MTQQDASNYRETNNGKACAGCQHGQFSSICLLHNFKCSAGHTCDNHTPATGSVALKDFSVVSLPPPHGYLVWRGKQTAIASPDKLPTGKVLILSDGEAYGLATLSQPAQMSISEFGRAEQAEKHRIREEERQILWPEAQALYVYSIKSWVGFSEPQPVIDDHLTHYRPTPEEAGLIEKSRRLPKVITLQPDAVCFTDDAGGESVFSAVPEARNKTLSAILQAIYGPVKYQDDKGNSALALYDLALVRQPALRFENILGRVMSAEKAHSGVMAAFILPAAAAARLALRQDQLPEGAAALPPDELHLTLIYLGKKDELADRELIERAMAQLASEWPPLAGKVGGIGRFSNVEADGTNAFYASFDAKDLPAFRQELVERLANLGVQSPSAHGFTPHITLAYLPQGAEIPNLDLPAIELAFTELCLAWGGEYIHYPLTGQVKKKSTEAKAMPYKIEKRDGEVCVVNSETGEVEKCYEGDDAQDTAMALLAALNINVEDAGGKTPSDIGAPVEKSQDEKQRSLQEFLERVRSSFRAKFGDSLDGPWVVDVFEDHIITDWDGTRYMVPFSELENRDISFAGRPDWVPVTVSYVPIVTTVDIKAGRRLRDAMMEKLRTAKQMIQDLMAWGDYADEPETEAVAELPKGSSGVAVKMVNGEPWHCSWSSNAFQDRDEETFSLKSLERYVQENSENEIKGYFNLWHIKNTDFAEKRFQAVIGKFLFEAGPYLKDYKGQQALAFFKAYKNGHPELAPEGWGSSVEYKYLPEEREQKVYEWVWITRTSTLARGAAANIWTKSSQEEFMMNDEQRQAAEAMFGKDFTDSLIAQGKQKTQDLENAGVASKEKAPEGTAQENASPPDPGAPAEGQPAAAEAQPAAADLNSLAQKMLEGLNATLAPTLGALQQQIASQAEQITALASEMKALKGEQALKQQVEMPRFTFDGMRASQATGTQVLETDELKNKRPQEAPVPTDGSMASAYFPARK